MARIGRYARKLGGSSPLTLEFQSYELREYRSAVMEVYPQTCCMGTRPATKPLRPGFRVGDVFADRQPLAQEPDCQSPDFSDWAGYT